MERELVRLSQLEQESQRLSKITEQRQQLFDEIGDGTGRVKADTIERARKIGRVRFRLNLSEQRAFAHLDQITQELENLTETLREPLISLAQSHIKEVASKKESLDEIRKYTNEGFLAKEILEKFEQEYRIVAAKPGTDPILKKGIEFLQQKQEQEKQVAEAVPSAPEEVPPTPAPIQPEAETPIEPVGKKSELEEAEAYVMQIRKQHARGLIKDEELQEAEKELGKLKGQVAPAETKEEKQLPKLVVDLTADKITIDGRAIEIKSAAQMAIFMHFVRNPQQIILEEDLTRIANEAGSKNPKAGAQMVFGLRQKFEPDSKNPTIFITTKNGYQLNAAVEIVEKEIEKKKRVKRVREAQQTLSLTLPDGQIIETDDENVEKILRMLLENPAQTEQLLVVLGKEYNKENMSFLERTMRIKIKSLLASKGWGIEQPIGPNERRQGQRAIYSLKKVEHVDIEEVEIPTEEKKEQLQKELDELLVQRKTIEANKDVLENYQSYLEEISTLIEQKEVELRLTQPITPEDLEEDKIPQVVEYPYVPTKDEKRSDEETKILDYIVKTLLVNSKVSFGEFQRLLYSEKRTGRAPGGGRRFFVYQGKEIKEIFRSAMRKIREEAEIPSLRETWSEQEKAIWEKIQQAAIGLSGGDMADFIRKILSEIDRSEREFYRNYPPEADERRIPWIRI